MAMDELESLLDGMGLGTEVSEINDVEVIQKEPDIQRLTREL